MLIASDSPCRCLASPSNALVVSCGHCSPLCITYLLGPWGIILIEEHFIFRRGQYNVEDWNTPQKLPVGWAALVSMAFGLLGVYLGAAQVRFVGPIANLFNPPYGMDIGFELGLVFAGIAYFFLRRMELALSGR